jgi:hypothetical protein
VLEAPIASSTPGTMPKNPCTGAWYAAALPGAGAAVEYGECPRTSSLLPRFACFTGGATEWTECRQPVFGDGDMPQSQLPAAA